MQKKLKTITQLWVASALFIILAPFFFSLAWGQSEMQFLLKDNKKYQNVLVKKVLKTDTIILDDDEVIRLIGLKAPEFKEKYVEKKRDSYGFVVEEPLPPTASPEEQALKVVRELLEKQHVRLEFDSSPRDDDFTTLAYVFLFDKNKNQEIFVNAEILRQGFANLSIHPPNTKYENKLRTAYQEAREQKRGLQGQ